MINSFNVFTLICIGILGAIPYRYIATRYRAHYLLCASLLVYGLWTHWAVLLLVAEMLVGWFVACAIHKNKNKKVFFSCGIILIVFILLFFKYFNLIVNTFNQNTLLKIIVPLGLSFYSFKIISFWIDIYREPSTNINFTEYAAYISLFLQIASGPISRKNEIAFDKNVDVKKGLEAVQRIVRGLFYKYAIADRLAVYTSSVMGYYENYSAIPLIMAMFFFSIQIYADFAGYSDIVIGLSNLYGFEVKDNFNYPYFSKSIKEFWSRWHISLSSWLKSYIYIPLGGNRKGYFRQKINVMTVFLISGVWHGATLSYIFWGIWHGLWDLLSPTKWRNKACEIVSTISTFVIISLGWLCFKLENISDLARYVKIMFFRWDLSKNAIFHSIMPFSNNVTSVALFITVMLMIVIAFIFELIIYKKKKTNSWGVTLIYFVLLILFGSFGSGNFIYANY